MVNQITSAFFHTSLAISTGPNASRARAASLTIPRVFNTVTDSGGLIPSISLAQGYAGIDIRWPQNISGYTWELIDNLSWIKGRHSIKIGGAIDKENKSQNQSNPNNNGTFTFNGSATRRFAGGFPAGARVPVFGKLGPRFRRVALGQPVGVRAGPDPRHVAAVADAGPAV